MTKPERLSSENILSFTESLGALLSSGLSVQDSLRMCAQIVADKKCTALCRRLEQAILNGDSFYQALAVEESFSLLYISLVKIGEKTGSAAPVFRRLSDYLREKRHTKRKIIQALIYPVTVCFTALIVSIFIVFFIFPRIQDIFVVFIAESEQAAQSVQKMRYGIIGITVFFTLCIFLWLLFLLLYKINKKAALYIDRLLLVLPVFGTVIKAFCTSDFAFAMDLLSGAGIPLVQALRQAASVVSNREYKKAVESCADDIFCGEKLSVSFSKQRAFPAYIVQWIGIGEKTGETHNVFKHIHRYYTKENEQLISTALTAAEPAFILAAGLIVLFLVIQFVLPVFSLLGRL